MTTRLYMQKRGPSGGAHLDITNLTGRKGTPFFDGQASLIEMGNRYEQGQASQGTFVMSDPAAEMPAADFEWEISPHVLTTWTEDAPGAEIWLARSRIVGYDGGRGVATIDNEVEFNITVEDCNVELRGQAFAEAWVRPEETDVQRLVALQLYTLNGASSTAPHFRETCNVTVNTSHLTPNTNTVTMPAKKYLPGTQPQEVVEDCAQMAGKMYGVVIHHTGGSHLCLLYVINSDHTTYASPCKISDHLSDWDPLDPSAPIFEPHWETSAASTTDFQTTLSSFVSIWGDGEQATYVEYPINIESYDYWAEEYHDSVSTSAAQSANRAAGILEERRQPILTHHPSVIVQADQVDLLAAGMSMQVRFAATLGGIYLDNWETRRIVELRWEPRHDGTYWAHMQMERPVLRVAPGKGHAGPIPPVQSEPPGGPITDYLWTFDDSQFDDTTGLYPVGSPSNSTWHPTYIHSHVLQPGIGNDSESSKPVIGAGTFHFRGNLRRGSTTYNPGGIRFRVRSQDAGVQNSETFSSFVTATTNTTVDFDVVFPAGTDTFTFSVPYNDAYIDEVELTHGTTSTGFVGTPPPPAAAGSGSIGTSPVYAPSDHQHAAQTAEATPIEDESGFFEGENVEEALQELASGSGANRPHSHPDYAEATVALTASPGGGWQWIGEPRVINYKGYVYWGAVRGDTGDITVRVVEESDPNTAYSEIVLNSALAPDVHNVPVFLVRDSDHKLMVWYCDHNGAALYQRVSTTSLDTDPTLEDGFAAETDIDSQLTGSLYTYPSVFQLPGIANDPLFLLVRAVSATQDEWHYSLSTNGGSTWAALTKIVDEPGGKFPYLKVTRNADGTRLDFCAIDDHPFDSNNSVYHFYYESAVFHDSLGTALTLPIDSTDMTLVYDGSATAAWVWDIAIGLDGHPRIAYSYPDTGTNHVYAYARWTGITWSSTTIADSIGEIIAGQPGGIAIDRTEPTIVYLIREAGGELEPFRASSFDGASNWQLDPLATDSAGVNITPAAVHVPNPDLRVDQAVRALWLTGTYSDFDDYSVGVSAAVTLTTAGAESSVSGGVGEILISDSPSTPLVFADLLQNEAQDDLLYADT